MITTMRFAMTYPLLRFLLSSGEFLVPSLKLKREALLSFVEEKVSGRMNAPAKSGKVDLIGHVR